MATITPQTLSALDGLASKGWLYTWHDLGPHLTCSEAETLGTLLASTGATKAAIALLDGHGATDEPYKEDGGQVIGDWHGEGSRWAAMSSEEKRSALLGE